MSKVLFNKEKIMSLISDLNLSLDVVNINKFDKINNTFGIIIDDILAGLFAALVMTLIIIF